MYTQEPDAFETQSELDMQAQLEKDIDAEYIKYEKQQNKNIIAMICILNNIQKKIDFHFSHVGKNFRLYFSSKYQYNLFMAQEKDSKKFNDIIEYFPDRRFEELANDCGARFILIRVR